MSDLIRHGSDFLTLLLIFAFGLTGMVYFRFETASQIAVALIMCALYVFWGVFHHLHDRDLSGKVVAEYLSLACLVFVVLSLFLLRA